MVSLKALTSAKGNIFMISATNQQHLINFAANGYEFFPLIKPRQGTKLGTPKGWPDMGTDDLAQLNAWLPTSKFGFGLTFGSKKYFAFDLDGQEGIDNFKDAMVKHAIPNPSIVFSTPSGGRHLLYSYPEGINIKNIAGWSFDKIASKQGTKIDIRADGGFLGSFGARNNGYKLLHGDPSKPLIELPLNIVELLPIKQTQPSLAASAMSLTKDLVASMETLDTSTSLYGVIPDVIYQGERDNCLFNLIASWVRSGLDPKLIRLLLKEAISRCEGDVNDINVQDMVSRTLSNPDFVFAKRSKALQVMLKNLVFLSEANLYMTLHDKSTMGKQACVDKFMNVKQEVSVGAEGKTKMVPVFNLWLSDTSRLSYKNFGYKPGAESIYYDESVGHQLANKYHSPDIVNRENLDLFDKFCEFAAEICGSEEKGMILVEFIAYLIQRPAKKVGIALVIITTKQGVGKNFFLKIVAKILGAWNVNQLYSDNITNNFNSTIEKSQLIIVNESIGESSGTYNAKNKNAQAMSRIKSMITDYDQPIERKGQDIVNLRTYTNFIFLSNDKSAVSFDMNDRRFLCIINESPALTKDFFDSMDILKSKQGLSAIVSGLRDLPLFRIKENMTHTDKTFDDLEVMKGSLTGHEETVFENISFKNYIFRSKFVTSETFKWYCVYEFGFDEKKDSVFIKRLMKKFFDPLFLSSKSRQAKQIKIEIPRFTIETRTDILTFGGNKIHSVYYLKPKYNEDQMFSTDFNFREVRESIKDGVVHFIDQMESGEKKPEMTMVKQADK